MTEITPSELKLIYLQIVLMAILGLVVLLYNNQPISQNYAVNNEVTKQTTVSSNNANWIVNLLPTGLGLESVLDSPGSQLFIVVGIFIIPLTIMNSIVAIRFIADLVKGIL